MAQAQYEILIPDQATAQATAQYLHTELQVAVHLENRTIFIEGSAEPHAVVKLIVEDTPGADSLVKQAAAYAAEVLRRDTVIVSKNGKNGIQTWPIRNTAPSSSTGSGL